MLWLRALSFTLLIPVPLFGIVPWLLRTRGAELFAWDAGPWRLLGWVPIAFGIAIYLRCEFDFVVEGRGTPAIYDPPRRLVIRHLYRRVRNPMYVAAALMLFGQAWLFGSGILLLYATGFMLGFHLFVVWYEEPHLRRIFGEEYEAYRRTVPRWVPRLRG